MSEFQLLGVVMAEQLTRKQSDVLNYLIQHKAWKGYAPTVKEVGIALGYGENSLNAIVKIYKQLQKKGYIEKDKNGKPIVIKDVLQRDMELAERIRLWQAKIDLKEIPEEEGKRIIDKIIESYKP